MKTIVDKLIKFSEGVGIGIFSYCAKLYLIPCMIAVATTVVMVFGLIPFRRIDKLSMSFSRIDSLPSVNIIIIHNFVKKIGRT